MTSWHPAALAAVACMLALPMASAPAADALGVHPSASRACMVDDVALPAGVPGEAALSNAAYTAHNRSVEADRSSVLRIMALAAALDEPVAFDDVVTYEEQRVEVCVHEGRTILHRHQAVTALALGTPQDTNALGDLLGEKRLVTAFHTTTRQNVSLDEGTALAAMAFAGAGGDVDFWDVVDVERETRTERTFSQVVDLEEVDAAAALAMQGARKQP